MKNKLVSMLTGAMISVTPITMAAAQNAPTPLIQLFPALSGISLTQDQQTKLENLTNQTLPQIQNLLTPEQQQKFQANLQQGQGVRVALSSLNLSSQQQSLLQPILKSVRSQLTQTLTVQQQRQILQNAWSLQQQGK